MGSLEAHALAILEFAVGQVVGLGVIGESVAGQIVSIGSAAIALVFMVAHALHAKAAK